MSKLRIVLIAVLSVLALAPTSEAARDPDTPPLSAERYELIVVEAEGCIYCQIFRRDVLPAYAQSPRAREVPLRFIDVNDAKFDEAIAIVPTVVLLKDQKEIDRFSGYVGPEAFFHAINRMMAGALSSVRH